MSLVDSLLTATIRADADALVMHVGERPYVIAPAGPIELSSQALTLQAMTAMVSSLLPPDAQQGLAEFGAVQHELQPTSVMGADRFTVVVARGGDDVWIELRRQRQAPDAASPEQPPAVSTEPAAPAPSREEAPAVHDGAPADSDAAATDHEPAPPAQEVPVTPPSEQAPVPDTTVAAAVPPSAEATPEVPPAAPMQGEPPSSVASPAAVVEEQPPHSTQSPMRLAASASSPASADTQATSAFEPAPASGASVIPMTRTTRSETMSPAARGTGRVAHIERLLAAAAARRATALFLTTQAPPRVRVDDEVQPLEGERELSAADVEAAIVEVLPDGLRDAFRRGEPVQWVADLPGVGRVSCSTFRDYRGPGALVQFVAIRPMSPDQLGLTREMRTLATEPEGLVLVAAPRRQGRTVLTGGLVEEANAGRRSYIITLQPQVRIVHSSETALVSQRELRGTPDRILADARAAVREQPDVLVIDDLMSPDMLQLATEAAGAGVLVFATIVAGSSVAALTRAAELWSPDRRRASTPLLAERLRGVVAQVRVNRIGGGRLSPRELLVPAPAVTSALADGRLADLPEAIQGSHAVHGGSIHEGLVELVRTGGIDVREAYRHAEDRDALVAALRRERIDTSALERLA